MKRLLILAIMAVAAMPGTTAQKGIRLSANAAIGGARWIGSDSENLDGTFACRLGVGIDFPISPIWGFRTGLNFESLGATEAGWLRGNDPTDDSRYNVVYDSSVTSLYLEVPLMATAKIHDGRKFGIVLNFGPYIGVGVGGKISVKREIDGDYSSWSDKLYGEGSTARRFDAGVGLGIGLEVKNFVFSLDNRFGVLHVSKGAYLYNCVTFLGAGYKF